MSATETSTHLRENPFELAQCTARPRRRDVRRRLEPDRRPVGAARRASRSRSPCRWTTGRSRVFEGYRVVHNIDPRAGEGRHPLPPDRHARRGQGARDVDDLEVRADGPPVRRRQGRRRLRSEAALRGGARAAHPPLHDRDHQRDRAGEGHPGARRRHRRAGDGVDLRHLLDERRPLGPRGRDRQAARARRLGRPRRRDRAGRPLLHPHGPPEARVAAARTPASRSRGSATSARNLARLLAEEGARVVAVSDSNGGVVQPVRSRRTGGDGPQGASTACSPASRAPTRSRTRSCSSSTATSSSRPRSSR